MVKNIKELANLKIGQIISVKVARTYQRECGYSDYLEYFYKVVQISKKEVIGCGITNNREGIKISNRELNSGRFLISQDQSQSQDSYLESKIKQASENWKGVDVEAYVNEVRGGEPKPTEPPLTAAEIMATNIYADHYIAIFDSETDKGEEVAISILAAKCALITIRHMIAVDSKSQFLRLIESEIQSINN